MPATRYVHALGYRWLNHLYDPLIRLTMADRRFKEQLFDQAGLSTSMRVLDVGCATGTLLLMLASRGVTRSIGLDGDPDIGTPSTPLEDAHLLRRFRRLWIDS